MGREALHVGVRLDRQALAPSVGRLGLLVTLSVDVEKQFRIASLALKLI